MSLTQTEPEEAAMSNHLTAVARRLREKIVESRRYGNEEAALRHEETLLIILAGEYAD